MTLLFRDFDRRIELRSSREGPVAFRHPSEAAHYLRKSSNRPAVIAVLRKALSEHHHVQVWRLSDDAVIDEVARRLVNGSLQLLEMFEHGTTPKHYNDPGMALLFRDFDKRVEIRSTRDGLIRYHRHAEAVNYLHEHSEEPGLSAALRQALAVHTRTDVGRLSDAGVIEEVERRLLNGSLQLMEMFAPRIEGRTTTPE